MYWKDWLILIVVLVIIALITYLIIRWIGAMIRRRREHVGDYFKANFRTMITEFDLITRPALREWRIGFMQRLEILDRDVVDIENTRTDIDKRLSGLERDLNRMERV